MSKPTHRMKGTSIYDAWRGMRYRCTNRNHKYYADYGGRGITVCDEWLHSFENFYRDMGDKPKGLSLDRIDNDKGYCKENCRWSTAKEQTNNKRNTVYVVYKGEIISVGNLATMLDLNSVTLLRRIRNNWTESRWGDRPRKISKKGCSSLPTSIYRFMKQQADKEMLQ